MLSYGVWTMLDGVAIWATNWVDSLLISHFMSDYYLGLYKNSVSTVTSLFSIITAAITPVLFASLARLQDDNEQFNRLFLKVQKMLATFLIPIGVGLLMYRELATEILFGNQWAEAANIIGIISLTTALRTVFISFYSDAYRAKGHFYISLIMQCFELVILIPACIISVKYGFWTLVYTRALLKLDLIIPEIIVVWKVCRISIKDTFKTLYRPILATLAMTMAIFALQLVSSRLYWELISIVIAIIVYFGVLFIFAEERKTFLFPIYKKLIKNKKL